MRDLSKTIDALLVTYKEMLSKNDDMPPMIVIWGDDEMAICGMDREFFSHDSFKPKFRETVRSLMQEKKANGYCFFIDEKLTMNWRGDFGDLTLEVVHSEPRSILIVGEIFGAKQSMKMPYCKTANGDIEIGTPSVIFGDEIDWMPCIMDNPISDSVERSD